jgi:hypothetical protein
VHRRNSSTPPPCSLGTAAQRDARACRLTQCEDAAASCIASRGNRLPRQSEEVLECHAVSKSAVSLAETPTPSLTDIARRLGLKSTSALTRQFPDLSTELERQRQPALDNGLHCLLESDISELPLAASKQSS